jgi:hypothetical protein
MFWTVTILFFILIIMIGYHLDGSTGATIAIGSIVVILMVVGKKLPEFPKLIGPIRPG